MGNNLYEDDQDHQLANEVKDILKESGNCAQTAFAVLQKHLNLEGEQILKALTPFPGLALRGESCGAVTGCLMALGLEFGRDDLTDRRGYIGSLPAARRFCQRFEEEHGGTTCAGILKTRLGRNFDLADITSAKEYVSAGGFEVCAQVVASAVISACRIISDRR